MWEEVGLKVTLVGPSGWEKADTKTNKDLVPPLFVNRHAITEEHDHSAFVFAARSDTRTVLPQTKEDEGAECVWLTKTELDELKASDERLRPEVYRYALMALELIT